MSRTLVLYQSKYGATRRYAGLLRSALGCDVYETTAIAQARLERYDCIIFAGGVYASGVAGLRMLQKYYARLAGKKLAVLCVGASPYDEAAFATLCAHNLRGPLAGIPAFYARGAWDESRMDWKDRTLCRLLQKAVAKKPPADCDPWMQALLGAAGQICDWTDEAYLAPLLAYVRDETEN